MWRFIELIQREETTVATDFARLEKGLLKTRGRNKKDIEQDLAIERSKTKYLSGSLNLDEYLVELSYKIHDYSKD